MPKRVVTVSQLIMAFDPGIYPRQNFNQVNVGAITEAILAGVVIDSPVVDAKTLKTVDGWHRLQAYHRVYGDDHKIEVETRSYPDRAAMVRDAIARNVRRGLDLTRWDVLRCAELADEVGIPINSLAQILGWRPEKLAAYRESRTAETLDHKRLVLKRSIRHMVNANVKLTKAQVEVNKHLSGMMPGYHVNQLLVLLDNDLMPTDNQELADHLSRLAEAIEAWLEQLEPSEEEREAN